MSAWVFAYGSNMDVAALRRHLDEHASGGTILRAEPAMLPGYRLVWNYRSVVRGGGAANVEPAECAVLPGVALELDETALEGVDRKEGHPHRYRRGPDRVTVELVSGGDERAWLYVVEPGHRAPVLVPPTRAYLDLLVAAAARYRFPAWYQQQLATTPTAD